MIIKRFGKLALYSWLVLHSLVAFADREDQHSFLSCALITSEYLTTLQLYQRGVPLETAVNNLPKISKSAKTRVASVYELAENIGILNAYADINTNYARCAHRLFKSKGAPAKDQVDYGYYFCSGENKIRFEIILHSDRYLRLDKVLQKTPDSHIKTAIDYYNVIANKGLLAAFDLNANNLKTCLTKLDSNFN